MSSRRESQPSNATILGDRDREQLNIVAAAHSGEPKIVRLVRDVGLKR